MIGRVQPVAVARARVTRANGATEVHYSYEPVPVWRFRRWLKLQRHLAFMRAEDKREGF